MGGVFGAYLLRYEMLQRNDVHGGGYNFGMWRWLHRWGKEKGVDTSGGGFHLRGFAED